MKRRRFLQGAAVVGALAGGGYWWLSRQWDGFLTNPCLSGLPESIKQSELWLKIWNNLKPELMLDGHVHVAGTGDSERGLWVNPKMTSWQHPWQHLQYNFYMNAACASAEEPSRQVDTLYYQRLLRLLEDMPPGVKLMLLAFDYQHDQQGIANPAGSTFYVPNSYARWLAQQHPNSFEWAASIHPYRKDAIETLEKSIEFGAMGVKWLPPAQNIDPASSRCDAFYKTMAKHDVALVCHAGEEKAVEGSDTQKYGNPLRLRRALDHGVKVIVSHCASLGHDVDLDNNNSPAAHFDLFARMMGESQYNGRLYGDISATTQVNRDISILKTLLSEQSWHSRLVNCSDYPIPSVMPLISVKKLVSEQLLDEKWSETLNDIRQYNAILFDFALKRLLQYNGHQFADSIFQSRTIYQTKK